MPTYAGSSKKEESSSKTSTSDLLTMPKPLTVWIKTNCGKFLEMGIPDHLTCLLRNLYAGQEATVRNGNGTTDWFQIDKEVCQGCILSPCLFNLYAEYIMRNTGLVQMVKNLPAMQETQVRSLSQEDPLEVDMATHSSILPWRIPIDRGAWQVTVHGVAKSQTRLSD